MLTEPRPLQSSWRLEPCYEARTKFISAQQVLVKGFPEYSPQNLEQDLNVELGIPTTKEPQVPDLDFGQWQRDANHLLHLLGQRTFDFGSLASNSFEIT
jgi:hypothetical protein